MKTIVIGDIHGCFRELKNLLQKVEFNREADRLVSLGDLIDRGKESYEVCEFFRKLKAEIDGRCIVIRGNHEQMMMEAADLYGRELWKLNGGGKTIRSFFRNRGRISVKWFKENTCLYYEEPGFQCAHAGVEDQAISLNDPETLLWDRERLRENDYSGKLTIIGHTPLQDAAWFAGDGKTEKVLLEQRKQPLPKNGLICIDTGCVFGNRLTAMVIEEGIYWLDSVPSTVRAH